MGQAGEQSTCAFAPSVLWADTGLFGVPHGHAPGGWLFHVCAYRDALPGLRWALVSRARPNDSPC